MGTAARAQKEILNASDGFTVEFASAIEQPLSLCAVTKAVERTPGSAQWPEPAGRTMNALDAVSVSDA